MSLTHPDWIILGTVTLALLVGRLWLGRLRSSSPAVAAEIPTLRIPRRPPANDLTDEDEPAPESGVRLKSGAIVRKVDSQRRF